MPSLLDTLEDPGEVPDKTDAVIHGFSGSGKSSLMRTLRGRVAVLSTPQKEGSAGTMVLKKWNDRIKSTPINDIKDLGKWATAFRDDNPKRSEKERYNWLVFDTTTGLVQLAIQEVLAKRPRQVKLGKRVKLTGDEWGAVAAIMEQEVASKFLPLPINTLWLCQSKDKRRGKRKGQLGPDVNPAMLNALVPNTLFTGRLYMVRLADGSREQRMQIGETDDVVAKYRCSMFDTYVPTIIKKPHISRLIDFLYEGGDCPFDEAIEEPDEEEEDDEDLEVVGRKTDDDDDNEDDDD